MSSRNDSLIVKLARFRRSVLWEAEEECAKIEHELTEYKERELSVYARQLDEKNTVAAGREIARLKLRYARELSAKRKEYRERLLLLREEYTEALCQSAENRLLEFSESKDYKEFLIKKARALANNNYKNPRLLVKSGDEKYSAEITGAYGGGTVEISPEIKLGGILLICGEARIIIDETLDYALKKQMESFRSSGKFGVWLAPLG